MLTLQQFYLTKLAEECNEVAQIALKTQQFGLDEVWRVQGSSNKERCHEELNDLMAVIEVLNESHGLQFVPDRKQIEAKKEKMLKYLKYSQGLGMVGDQ